MAEKTEFLQAIDDAILDADSLERFINGSEDETVLTRLSAEYPTLQKALKELFESGGIADRFKTLAELQSSSLVDGDYALVADDDNSKNGIYIKKGGQWVKSKYDVMSYVQNNVLSHINTESGYKTILGLVDSNDAPVLRIDENGGVYLLDLHDTIQSIIKNIEQNIISISDNYSSMSVADDSIAVVVDKNGLPLLKVNKDGRILIKGLHHDLQTHLSRLGKAIDYNDPNNDILFLTDANSNPTLKIDANGNLYLKNISGAVQDAITHLINKTKNISKKIDFEIDPFLALDKKQSVYAKNYTLDTSKHGLAQSIIELINKARAIYPSVSPVPNNSLPQSFDISDTWINDLQLKVQNPDDFVNMSGFDPLFRESIGVVHPQVWSFNDRVAGYKYWLSVNPYTNGRDAIELPFLYGSNDPEFRDWNLIEGFPAPFEADPIHEDGSYHGHLSDATMTYDPLTGDIVYIWRKTLYWDEYSEGGRRSDSMYRASRYNGVAWSDVYDLMPTHAGLSPAVLFNPNDNLFYLYEQVSYSLYYRTAPNLDGGGWSERQKCNLSHQDGKVWHLEAKYIGNQVVLLIHGDNLMSNKDEGDVYYFAVSNDFINFSVSQKSIITNTEPNIYKASFHPVWINDTQTKFRIVYTSDSLTNPQYQLHVTDTNTVNLGVQ